MGDYQRVIRHVGALYGVTKAASRRYRCDGHLTFGAHRWIEEGQSYVVSALPPDDPDVGNRDGGGTRGTAWTAARLST